MSKLTADLGGPLFWVTFGTALLVFWDVGDDRDVGSYAGEVRDKAEASYMLFGLRSIEFSNDVGRSLGLAHDNDWAIVSGQSLPV